MERVPPKSSGPFKTDSRGAAESLCLNNTIPLSISSDKDQPIFTTFMKEPDLG